MNSETVKSIIYIALFFIAIYFISKIFKGASNIGSGVGSALGLGNTDGETAINQNEALKPSYLLKNGSLPKGVKLLPTSNLNTLVYGIRNAIGEVGRNEENAPATEKALRAVSPLYSIATAKYKDNDERVLQLFRTYIRTKTQASQTAQYFAQTFNKDLALYLDEYLSEKHLITLNNYLNELPSGFPKK